MELDTTDTFEEWIASRVTSLLRFAWLVTGSQSEAEDALQTALAKACADWDRIRERDEVDAYVRRMIANAHISAWRRFGRWQSPAADVRQSGAVAVAGVEAAVVERDLVWRVCSALPRQQRAAVVLRYYEDYDTAEIARVLGCSEVTVRSHLHRALARLRIELERGETDE